MIVRRAVITAAGPERREYPLQRLVDRDGVVRPALRIIVEEALAAGVEEIAVVVRPGDEDSFAGALEGVAGRFVMISQDEPKGYGDAILRARDFTAAEPFLHFVGDHLYVSDTEVRCARQLVEIAAREDCAVSAVQPTRESMLPYFGAVGGRRVAHAEGLHEIDTVLEKPTPTRAEQELVVPGLRAGHYLCFFGMHVFTPTVFELLASAEERGRRDLSPSLARLARRERYLAYQVHGTRYDLGGPWGLLTAQLALGLSGPQRADVLAQIVELLARQPQVP